MEREEVGETDQGVQGERQEEEEQEEGATVQMSELGLVIHQEQQVYTLNVWWYNNKAMYSRTAIGKRARAVACVVHVFRIT